MVKYAIAIAAAGLFLLLNPQDASAQASKALEKKPIGSSSQQNSWDQVDRINKESDGTRSRYYQSRESAGLNKKGYTGGRITRSSVFPTSRKIKATPNKSKPVPKKK